MRVRVIFQMGPGFIQSVWVDEVETGTTAIKWLCAMAYNCLSLVPVEPLSPWAGRTVRHEGPKPWQTLKLKFIVVPLPSSELLKGVGGSWPDLSSPVPFRPLFERRKFLHDNMVEIPNRIMFSEMKQVAVSESHPRQCPSGLKAGQRAPWVRCDWENES